MELDLALNQRMLITEPENSSVLAGAEASRYFKLLRRALPLGPLCLAARDAVPNDAHRGVYEGKVLGSAITRLLYTTSALEMKYAFKENGDVAEALRVDLTDSGFMNYADIVRVADDLAERDAALKHVMSEEDLKRLNLDCLLKEQRESRKLLEALAQRTYLEMLNRDKLFLPYTPGALIPWETSELGMRGYIFSWGCYNATRNCPYEHVMYFEQDFSEVAFESGGENLAQFLKVMHEEGTHIPERLDVLAKSVDDRLDPIHPKIIKRVRIGPFYAPLLIKQRSQEELNPVEITVQGLLSRTASEEDFALFLTEEMVFSQAQVTQSKNLGFKQVVREVFYIPPLDALEDIHRYIIMPHRAFQHITPEEAAHLPGFSGRVKFGYDQKGNVHAVN